MVRAPTTNQALLWLGAISIAFGLLALVKSAGSGWWTLGWSGFGVLLLAFGADARRLWTIRDAVRTGAIVGGCLSPVCVMFASFLVAILVVAAAIAISAAFAVVLAWADRMIVRQLVRAHRTNQPVEPSAITAVRSSRRVVFEVAFLLAEWERFDVLEQLAMHSFVPGAESLRRFYLALALHARGQVAAAKDLALTTNQVDHGPYVKEAWDQLVARIQISQGEAKAVVTTFAPTSTVDHATLLMERKLVLADAHTVLGNVDVARTLVTIIAKQRGTAFLERLRASTRPAAAIATSMLATPDSPYR